MQLPVEVNHIIIFIWILKYKNNIINTICYSRENNFHRSCDILPQRHSSAALAPPKWPSVIVNSPSIYSIHSRDQLYNNLNDPPASGHVDTFDLDRIERERRKSHASLFDLNLPYNMDNDDEYGKSTAV